MDQNQEATALDITEEALAAAAEAEAGNKLSIPQFVQEMYEQVIQKHGENPTAKSAEEVSEIMSGFKMAVELMQHLHNSVLAFFSSHANLQQILHIQISKTPTQQQEAKPEGSATVQ